jgi:hypothetical protein
MDDALARHVDLAGYQSQRGLDRLVELLKNHVTSTEHENFRAAVTSVDQKVQALLELVFANHPGLQKDFAEKTAKYGKPI